MLTPNNNKWYNKKEKIRDQIEIEIIKKGNKIIY